MPPAPPGRWWRAAGIHSVGVSFLGFRSPTGEAAERRGGLDASFGVSYERLKKLDESFDHALGFRLDLSFPRFRSVQPAALVSYALWPPSGPVVAAGPLWRYEDQRGNVGFKVELTLRPGGHPWALFVGLERTMTGLVETAALFGVRFQLAALWGGD